MKRGVVFSGVAVLALGAAVGTRLWAVQGGTEGERETRRPEDARGSTRARAPRKGGLGEVAVASPGGTLAIRGRVTGPAGPVAFAVVAAFDAAPDEGSDPLWRQICPSEGDLPALDQCDGEDEISAAWAGALAARAMERPALARATTDAEGRFSLEGLAAGRYDLWAERAGGFARETSLEAPAEDVVLALEAGVLVRGQVRVNGAPPDPPLLVSGVAIGFPRVFEALAAEDGSFALGPMPATDHAVASTSLAGFLGAHRVLEAPGAGGGERAEDVLLELSSPRRVSGVVLEDGRPAPGVELALTGYGPTRKLTSDSSGRFDFSSVRPGDYELSGKLPHAAGVEQVLVPEDRDPVQVTLELELTGRVRGLVQDGAGQPIKGAMVLVAGHEPELTEADGRFEVSFPGGRERLVVRAEGYVTVDEEIDVPVGTTLERMVTVRRAAVIRGTVVDEAGKPVQMARVAIQDAAGESGDSSTAEDGSFELESEGPSTEVLVEAGGFIPSRQIISTAVPGRIVLRHGGALSIRLLDADGRLVPDAAVTAMGPRGEAGPTVLVGRSTEEGIYLLSGLAAGDYRVEARTEIAWTKRVIHSEGRGEGSLELRLPALGKIHGSVVGSSGAPVAEAYVRATEAQDPGEKADGRRRRAAVARTDEQGQFQLHVARGRRYVLFVWKDYRPDVSDIAADVDGPPVKIVLSEPATVRGRVLYLDGKPASLFFVDGERRRAADGRFEQEVTPGKVDLRLGAPGHAALLRRLTVREGEQVDLGDVVLGEGRTLEVRVVDAATGAPVQGATVRVIGLGGSDEGETFYSSDAPCRRTRSDGSAELRNVPDDALLEVEARGYRTVTTAPGAGASLLVRLEPHGALRVVVDGARDRPLWASVEGPEDRTSLLDPAGEAVFQALPPGRYLVTVWTVPPPSGSRQAGTLAPVQPVEINFPLEGDGDLHLRLRSTGSDVSVRLAGNHGPMETLVTLLPSAVDASGLTLDRLGEMVAQVLLPERPLQRGPAHFRNVPDGSYRVAVVVFGRPGHGLYVDPRPLEVRTGGGPREVQVAIPDDLDLGEDE